MSIHVIPKPYTFNVSEDEPGPIPPGFTGEDDRFDRIVGNILLYAKRNQLQWSDDFVSELRGYYSFMLQNVGNIEQDVQSKITIPEISFALWSLGLSSVSIAIGERNGTLKQENLLEAINRAKDRVDALPKQRFTMRCPLPTCWKATSTLIKISRDIFGIETS